MRPPASPSHLWLVALIAGATASFAAVHLPARLAVVVLAGALSTWTLAATAPRSPAAARIHLLGLTLLGLTALDLIPLPTAFREWLQPGVAPVVDQVLALAPPGLQPLAVHPHAALLAWAEGGTLLLVLLATQRLANTHTKRARLARSLGWIGAAVALLAALHAATDASSIYGFTGIGADTGKPTLAPFVNPNHGAAFLAALLPLGIGAHTYRKDLLSGVTVTALLLLGLALAQSRGGTLAAAVGLITLGILATPRPWSLGILAIVGLSGATLAALERMQILSLLAAPDPHTSFATGRLSIWGDALRLIGDAPLLGVGPGGFSDAYGLVKSSPRFSMVAHAHQDLLQFTVECGILGLVLLLALLAVVAYEARRGLLRHHHGRRRTLRAAYLGSMAALLTSSMVDFPMHIGANALLAAVVVGAAVSSQRDHSESQRRVCWRGAAVYGPVLTALLLYLGLGRGSSAWGDAGRSLEVGLSQLHDQPQQALIALEHALRQRPLDHHALLAIGVIEDRLGNHAAALHADELATRVRPGVPWTWRALARARLRQGDPQGALLAWRGMLALNLRSKDEVLPYLEEAMDTGADPLSSLLVALPDVATRHCQAARLLHRRSLTEDAEMLLLMNLDRYPCATPELASIYLSTRRYEEALALVSPPDERCDHLKLGARALYELGRYQEALPWYKDALLRCSSDHYRIRRGMALAAAGAGDEVRALRILRSLAEEDPGDRRVERALRELLDPHPFGDEPPSWPPSSLDAP